MKNFIFIFLLSISSTSFAHHKPQKFKRYPIPKNMDSLSCMAINLYFEGRGERKDTDLAAIGYVVLNRVKNKYYPNDVCHVVYEQKKSNRTKRWVGMYSWTLDGKSDIPKNTKAFVRCLHIAKKILSGTIKNSIHDATHYHNNHVVPYWSKKLSLVAKTHNHKFYK